MRSLQLRLFFMDAFSRVRESGNSPSPTDFDDAIAWTVHFDDTFDRCVSGGDRAPLYSVL